MVVGRRRETLCKRDRGINSGRKCLANHIHGLTCRRHFYQHASFRLVSSSDMTPSAPEKSNVYEMDVQVSNYCHFHYGSIDAELLKDVPNFPAKCAELCLEAFHQFGNGSSSPKALDMGCSVGRSSFELASHFDVTGVDFSARFVSVASQLQRTGS